MSKAFVIKNKEGKYWQFFYNDESEFVDEIYNAFMHYSKENAEKDIIDFDLKDCEVVEITIAEFDNSKREYNETIKYVETTEPDKVAEYIDNLEQQLAEKGKEIKSLEQQIENNQRDYVSELAYYTAEENVKEIRKEICEKIKNLIDICFDAIETTNENGTKYSKEFSFKKFNAIINTIEQGEQQ
ncbi:MAG: hypothetical protein J6S85_01110 [Methanobrevibacter sp.]|nr:hypothetical protein [Methanobrevibacter sp.]MBO7712131.1 hypothetical protein [Methanobrevibacter sp.]